MRTNTMTLCSKQITVWDVCMYVCMYVWRVKGGAA